MKSNNKIFNSLEELRSLDLSSFPSNNSITNDESHAIENLDFSCLDTNDSLNAKINRIGRSDTLSKDQLESPNYKIVISDKTKSFRNKGLNFSNFLSTNNMSNRINSQIVKVLSLDGKLLKPEELPLTVDGELDFHQFRSSSRIKKIFRFKGIRIRQTDKWMYRDQVSSDFLFKTNMDILRIYTQKDNTNNILTIVLFDPHHLLATSKISHFKTKNIDRFNICISNLLT